MKTFFVKTQTSVNEMSLHCTHVAGHGSQREFTTTSKAEAFAMFEKEVECLSQTYLTVSQLDYSPTDYEYSHAISCTLGAVNEDGEIEFIEDSEYFFEK